MSKGGARLDEPYLPYDFVKDERKERLERFESLRRNEPKDDNERLLNLVYRYKKFGDMNALAELYGLSKTLALKFVNVEARKNKVVRRMGKDDKKAKAEDAVLIFVERLMESGTGDEFLSALAANDDDNGAVFYTQKNVPGYLYLQVLKSLYYQPKSETLVEYCDDERMAAYIKKGAERWC